MADSEQPKVEEQHAPIEEDNEVKTAPPALLPSTFNHLNFTFNMSINNFFLRMKYPQ